MQSISCPSNKCCNRRLLSTGEATIATTTILLSFLLVVSLAFAVGDYFLYFGKNTPNIVGLSFATFKIIVIVSAIVPGANLILKAFFNGGRSSPDDSSNVGQIDKNLSRPSFGRENEKKRRRVSPLVSFKGEDEYAIVGGSSNKSSSHYAPIGKNIPSRSTGRKNHQAVSTTNTSIKDEARPTSGRRFSGYKNSK